jgi:hypothetical protein
MIIEKLKIGANEVIEIFTIEELEKVRSAFGRRMIEHASYWGTTYEGYKWKMINI